LELHATVGVDGYLVFWYHDTIMVRMNLTLSDHEHEALRRLAFERRLSIAELIRLAVDQAYGTDHDEITGPGRRPGAKGTSR
jgi:hypothetical protein